MKKLARKLAKNGTVRVGFLESATYPDGTPVAQIAAIQNFGAPAAGIPARPFFSNMVNRDAGGWGTDMKKALEAADYDVPRALAFMGERIAGKLREEIVATVDPKLAAQTVRRKGFDKPLVDTGHLLASVDYEVEE